MNNSLFLNKTYSISELKGLLESILFLKGKPVGFDELKEIFEMSESELNRLVEEMNSEYREKNHGFTIIHVANGLQLVTNPIYRDELSELFGKKNDYKIPRSALETLAIVAYKQPVTKEEIDSIKGVSSTRSINLLLSMKLINISGVHPETKSPLYSTTERFLEVFRIKSLADLPPIDTIDFDNLIETEDEESSEEKEEELSLYE
jgi:segregation and condensation protein B